MRAGHFGTCKPRISEEFWLIHWGGGRSTFEREPSFLLSWVTPVFPPTSEGYGGLGQLTS